MTYGKIIEHTERVAAELAKRYEGNPEGQVEVWVSTAQQREAMVVQLYSAEALSSRMPEKTGEPEMNHVVRKAIGGIWAQESSHTTLMEALRVTNDEKLTSARTLMGTVEGTVTQAATAGNWLTLIARIMIKTGQALGQAPDFTADLKPLTLREYCEFSQELEHTAAAGYAQIIKLIDELEEKGPSIKYGVTQRYEFQKTMREERFHGAVFERLLTWMSPDGNSFRPLDARDAVLELRAIANQHLSLAPVKTTRRASTPSELRDVKLISDGGLGALFADFGVATAIGQGPSPAAH